METRLRELSESFVGKYRRMLNTQEFTNTEKIVAGLLEQHFAALAALGEEQIRSCWRGDPDGYPDFAAMTKAINDLRGARETPVLAGVSEEQVRRIFSGLEGWRGRLSGDYWADKTAQLNALLHAAPPATGAIGELVAKAIPLVKRAAAMLPMLADRDKAGYKTINEFADELNRFRIDLEAALESSTPASVDARREE